MTMVKFDSTIGVGEARLIGGFLKERQQTALDSTIPATMEKTVSTGRLDAFKLDWKPGMPNMPHIFWDSDTAKVLEGMAAALALRPDPALEAEYDRWVELIVSAQQPDGYLNTHFTVVSPGKRFTNLCHWHELYCCGHLIEAAVAGYTLLGKRKLLDCMMRYADFLCATFGPGKRRGWPGHEEIELALVKLYRVTGKKDYLDLATYFINDRGTKPHFFREEEKTQGYDDDTLLQTHLPVRQQTTAEGHSVRAMYLFTGAADVARETGDAELLDACKAVYENVVSRRMYVTGGIGSTFQNERFTTDYDLTNGSMMYAESCAAIGLALFCQRMMDITGEAKYADTLEQALFNGILSGISLSGDKYFYTNYLEVDDNLKEYNSGTPVRVEWFSCSCCPTNFARFLTQMQQFVFSASENELRIQLPVDAEIRHRFPNGSMASLDISGGYPFNGCVAITVREAGNYALSVRIPGWCHQATAAVNGEAFFSGAGGCYAAITREWKAGDVVTMDLSMPVEFLRSHEKVTCNAGRVAIRRGPVVYCLESCRMEGEVRNFIVDEQAGAEVVQNPQDLPDSTCAIRVEGFLEVPKENGPLYFTGSPSYKPCKALAIPYALWGNQGKTNMAVWLRSRPMI